METKHTFICKKLVRDKIPEILAEQNIEFTQKILQNKELELSLKNKLLEEADEVKMANDTEIIEELADVLEVIINLAKFHGKNLDDVICAANNKKHLRGGFEKGIFIDELTVSSNNPKCNYYKTRPSQYPEKN